MTAEKGKNVKVVYSS